MLIRSIISLGTSLGLRIVAEGVESAEVLETLRDLGCDIIQGYHVGRPVPGNELATSVTRSGLTILETVPHGRNSRKAAQPPPKTVDTTG